LRSADYENSVAGVDSGLIHALLEHAPELGAILRYPFRRDYAGFFNFCARFVNENLISGHSCPLSWRVDEIG
jgi:hypothetical protein